MFKTNESMVDRMLRLIIGALLIYAWYAMWVSGAVGIVALVIGIVLAVTAIIGWCPLYTLFGFGSKRSAT